MGIADFQLGGFRPTRTGLRTPDTDCRSAIRHVEYLRYGTDAGGCSHWFFSTCKPGRPCGKVFAYSFLRCAGWVAQLVEQRTENPCVGGSIPPPATTFIKPLQNRASLTFAPVPLLDCLTVAQHASACPIRFHCLWRWPRFSFVRAIFVTARP